VSRARLAALAILAAADGASAPVAPYQRGYLARPEMAMEPDRGTATALDKLYPAKEAARGGASVGGGGCGCN
jgi:hypothetical protein